VKLMKKLIAVLMLLTFVIAVAGTVYADSRTPAEKLAAGRAYLKLLDKKIIRLRKAGKTAVVAKMKVEKKSTIARMQVWKAQAQASVVPAPVAPTPPPPPRRVVKPTPAPSAGMFGMGLLTSADVGYITGGSAASILAGGAIILDDPMAIGTMLGLSANAVNYKVGLGLTYGKDINDNTFNAITATFDGILNLPEEMLGVASYVGAQVNYPIYKSDITGAIGGFLYYGIKGDVGLGGISYAELGYGAVRRDGFSTKGIEIKVGQEILL
jgi:hypothetical protein